MVERARRDRLCHDDVTAATERETERVELVEGASGAATVASYTVLYENGAPKRAVLLCDLDDGRRTLALCDDGDLVAVATREELCGRALRIAPGGSGRLRIAAAEATCRSSPGRGVAGAYAAR